MSLERRQGACIPSQRIPKTWIKASPASSLSLFSLHFELISSTLWSVLHFKEIWSVHPLASSLALLTVLVLAFWTCSSHLIGPPFPPQRLLSTGTPATAMLTAGRLLLTSLSPSQKVLRLTLPPTPTPELLLLRDWVHTTWTSLLSLPGWAGISSSPFSRSSGHALSTVFMTQTSTSFKLLYLVSSEILKVSDML